MNNYTDLGFKTFETYEDDFDRAYDKLVNGGWGMRCSKCSTDLPEREIEESHDVPCYLFKGLNRKEKKNQADKFGRHWLCKKCHEQYEEGLRLTLKIQSTKYAKIFFR